MIMATSLYMTCKKNWCWYHNYSCWLYMTFHITKVLLIMFLIFPSAAKEVDDDDIDHDAVGQCPKALFAFGASASDTGTVEAAFPFTYNAQTTLPYGETFFQHPANRYSDGRLIIDFYGNLLY